MSRSATVQVPQGLNLEQSQKVLASVLGKLGHPACYSGFKISFQDLVDPAELKLTIDKSLQIREEKVQGH